MCVTWSRQEHMLQMLLSIANVDSRLTAGLMWAYSLQSSITPIRLSCIFSVAEPGLGTLCLARANSQIITIILQCAYKPEPSLLLLLGWKPATQRTFISPQSKTSLCYSSICLCCPGLAHVLHNPTIWMMISERPHVHEADIPGRFHQYCDTTAAS